MAQALRQRFGRSRSSPSRRAKREPGTQAAEVRSRAVAWVARTTRAMTILERAAGVEPERKA